MVQWLRHHLPTEGAQVQALAGEPGIPYALWAKNQNINNRSDIVTNSIKTLNIKKILIKEKESIKQALSILDMIIVKSELFHMVFSTKYSVE